MDCCSLHQGIFPIQGSNLGLPHCRQIPIHCTTKEVPLKFSNSHWVHLFKTDPIIYCSNKCIFENKGLCFPGGSPGNELIQETQVRSLDWEDPLKKEMATHSSILAWKIPWRRAWQPNPVFLPGEFHGQRSLVGHVVAKSQVT